ncbi:hypothetical protein C8F04DRAFT_1265533 [Mycena alexandri]|uniref:Uncharacterized protein n=1 Tax=Mycena alexandri TaxID=1745969 RepID=A0AAD6SKW0_9AGAR|nr:hypothetical protein C8F04DRAFT_1265533 [Mycena alexandri]
MTALKGSSKQKPWLLDDRGQLVLSETRTLRHWSQAALKGSSLSNPWILDSHGELVLSSTQHDNARRVKKETAQVFVRVPRAHAETPSATVAPAPRMLFGQVVYPGIMGGPPSLIKPNVPSAARAPLAAVPSANRRLIGGHIIGGPTFVEFKPTPAAERDESKPAPAPERDTSIRRARTWLNMRPARGPPRVRSKNDENEAPPRGVSSASSSSHWRAPLAACRVA